MILQYIHDSKGNKTGVFITIEDWQKLKENYPNLQSEETINNLEIISWQKEILDERLEDYYKNPNDIEDFNVTIANIRKNL